MHGHDVNVRLRGALEPPLVVPGKAWRHQYESRDALQHSSAREKNRKREYADDKQASKELRIRLEPVDIIGGSRTLRDEHGPCPLEGIQGCLFVFVDERVAHSRGALIRTLVSVWADPLAKDVVDAIHVGPDQKYEVPDEVGGDEKRPPPAGVRRGLRNQRPDHQCANLRSQNRRGHGPRQQDGEQVENADVYLAGLRHVGSGCNL
jgi:hypothetical protein